MCGAREAPAPRDSLNFRRSSLLSKNEFKSGTFTIVLHATCSFTHVSVIYGSNFPFKGGGGGQPPHLVKKMKFGIFNFFLLGAVNKHPNCVKMKFEGDLTSIMVTRDFLGTATTTRFALTRQGNGCGVDGNHDVGDRG